MVLSRLIFFKEMFIFYQGTQWLAASDLATPGTFKWNGGQSISYSNWSSGQPNRGRYGILLDSWIMYRSLFALELKPK
jgi:hypothetical protein